MFEAQEKTKKILTWLILPERRKFGPFTQLEACHGVEATWHRWQCLSGSFVHRLTDGGTLRGSEARPPSALADKWPHYSSTGHVFLIHRTPWWRPAPRETSLFEPCQALGLFWAFFSFLGTCHTISFQDHHYQPKTHTHAAMHRIFNPSTITVYRSTHHL